MSVYHSFAKVPRIYEYISTIFPQVAVTSFSVAGSVHIIHLEHPRRLAGGKLGVAVRKT